MAQATIQTTVTGLQDIPVSATPPTVGQVLVFNGTSWVPSGAINGPLSITGALTAGSLNAGAAALSGPLTSTNNISTSGNLAVTGSGQVQSPGNAGSLINGSGYNLVSDRATATRTGLATGAYSTTSTSQVMLGANCTFTPRTSGRVLITASAQIANGSASSGVAVAMAYGTGTPPTAGQALTGNGLGYGPTLINPSNVWAFFVPWASSAVLGGLTVGTTYWVDFTIQVYGGAGPALIQFFNLAVVEL